MTRFLGIVGYSSDQVETSPGVYENQIEEREHKGELIRDSFSTRFSSQINDDIVLGHRLTIIADAELENMFPRMLYVVIKGYKWTVKSVEFQRPRVIIKIGGLYNG